MSLYESKLTNSQIKKYRTQIILPQINVDGQNKLKNSKILIVGLGGLGSPVCQYLANSGIGTIGIVDYDEVEINNLHRQIIYGEKDVGKQKAACAKQYLEKMNSEVQINMHDVIITNENIAKIINEYDLVLDCTDDIKTRYLLNDYCVIYKKKFIAASVLKWEGQIFVFKISEPCYRCLFPEIKSVVQNCDEAGVVGPVCGILGTMQATEAIKMLLGLNEPKIITYDALFNTFETFKIENRKKCDVCLQHKLIQTDKTKVKPPPITEKLDERYLLSWDRYFTNPEKYVLIDIRNANAYEMCHIKNSINIPEKDIEKNIDKIKSYKEKLVILCKKGITATKAARYLFTKEVSPLVMEGGLQSFKSKIDDTWPL
ncbi:Molybdenum cofactor synthesis protein 3 [Binucleata daphniae]